MGSLLLPARGQGTAKLQGIDRRACYTHPDSVIDSIGDRPSSGDGYRFSQAFSACGVSLPVICFDRQGDYIGRYIHSRGYLIVMPVPVHHLAGLVSVEDSCLCQAQSYSHGYAAEDLVVKSQPVHHAAAVVSTEEADDLNLTGEGIHLHFAELRGERVYHLSLRIRSTVANPDNEAAFFQSRYIPDPNLPFWVRLRNDRISD